MPLAGNVYTSIPGEPEMKTQLQKRELDKTLGEKNSDNDVGDTSL